MPKRPRMNKRIDAPHVRLYSWLLNSPAYLSLSCPARALLVESSGSTMAEITARSGCPFARLPIGATLRAERPNVPLPNSRRAVSSSW